MDNLTFGPLNSSDIHQFQQMIQGTRFSSMHFNQYSVPVIAAYQRGQIVGFSSGHKCYGEAEGTLVIGGTYLCPHADNDHNQSELQVALINWAKEKLGVTHYKLNEFDDPKPICISHVIPERQSVKPAEIKVDRPIIYREVTLDMDVTGYSFV